MTKKILDGTIKIVDKTPGNSKSDVIQNMLNTQKNNYYMTDEELTMLKE